MNTLSHSKALKTGPAVVLRWGCDRLNDRNHERSAERHKIRRHGEVAHNTFEAPPLSIGTAHLNPTLCDRIWSGSFSDRHNASGLLGFRSAQAACAKHLLRRRPLGTTVAVSGRPGYGFTMNGARALNSLTALGAARGLVIAFVALGHPETFATVCARMPWA